VVRIASYNVENLFARPKVFRTADWGVGEPKLAAYEGDPDTGHVHVTELIGPLDAEEPRPPGSRR
jgi:hypothetical protein